MIILTYCLTSTTSLAACLTPCGFQAGHSRVQGSTRSRTAVPLQRLSVGGRSQLMSAISWCTDMSYRGPRPCSLVTGALLCMAGQRVWNSLPAPLRDTNSNYHFRKQLKTYLFSGGCRAEWLRYMFLSVTNTLTYLLTYYATRARLKV